MKITHSHCVRIDPRSELFSFKDQMVTGKKTLTEVSKSWPDGGELRFETIEEDYSGETLLFLRRRVGLMDNGADTAFLKEREELVSSLREKGLIFERMASFIQGATTSEMLQERIEDCKRSNSMLGDGGGDA